jgi:hypothetical protein
MVLLYVSLLYWSLLKFLWVTIYRSLGPAAACGTPGPSWAARHVSNVRFDPKPNSMSGKTVLITGGNTGSQLRDSGAIPKEWIDTDNGIFWLFQWSLYFLFRITMYTWMFFLGNNDESWMKLVKSILGFQQRIDSQDGSSTKQTHGWVGQKHVWGWILPTSSRMSAPRNYKKHEHAYPTDQIRWDFRAWLKPTCHWHRFWDDSIAVNSVGPLAPPEQSSPNTRAFLSFLTNLHYSSISFQSCRKTLIAHLSISLLGVLSFSSFLSFLNCQSVLSFPSFLSFPKCPKS